MKTEAGALQPQAKERQEPPAAGRAEEGFSPRGSVGNMTLMTPRFGIQRVNFCCFRHVYGNLLQLPQETQMATMNMNMGEKLLSHREADNLPIR